MSIRMERRIAKANVAFSSLVKEIVWVRNPGPMADVAIRNAAPRSTLRVSLLLLSCVFSSSDMRTPPYEIVKKYFCDVTYLLYDFPGKEKRLFFTNCK